MFFNLRFQILFCFFWMPLIHWIPFVTNVYPVYLHKAYQHHSLGFRLVHLLCLLIFFFFFFFFDLWVSSQYVGKCFKSLFLGLFAHYSGGIVCMRKVLERSVVTDCACKWKFDKVKGHHYHSTCTQIFETSLTVTNVNVYNLFQGLEEVPSKKRNDVKKHIQKIVEKRYMSVSTMLFLIKTLLISFW